MLKICLLLEFSVNISLNLTHLFHTKLTHPLTGGCGH